MSCTEMNGQEDILRLTQTAAEAAALGQWDAVAQCYGERGTLLASMQTPVQEAGNLLKLDEQVCDHVRTVQVVLATLLGEATATRQCLQGLHQRLGGQPSSVVTVSIKA